VRLINEDEGSWEICTGCIQRIILRYGSTAPIATQDDVLLSPAFDLCCVLLSVALSHGCRIMSELLGGEGYEAVEEVWWMRVSDHHPFLGVPVRDSPFTF